MKREKSLVLLGSIWVVLLLVALPLVVTLAGPAPALAAEGKMTLRIGTSRPGSATYVVGAAISRVTGKYSRNLSMEVVAITGSSATLRLLPKKEIDWGNGPLFEVYESALGIGEFVKDGKLPVRVVFRGHDNVWQFFTINREIKTLADLKGRAIIYKQAGAATKMAIANSTFEWLEKKYGFSQKDVKGLKYGGAKKAVEALTAGTGDVASTFAKAAGALLELAVRKPNFHILPYPEECRDYIVQKYPMFHKTVVAKGTYEKYPVEDIPVLACPNVIYAHKDLPEDAVYQVIKAVFDHRSEFQGLAGKVGPEYTLENAVQNPQAPFHPGAIKYYKEKGVWTDSLAKRQATMLGKVESTK